MNERTPEEQEQFLRDFYIDLIEKELKTASIRELKLILAFARA